VNILLQGLGIPTTLVCLPDANKTLLGIDFLQAGNIAINLGQRCWYFAEDDFNQHERRSTPCRILQRHHRSLVHNMLRENEGTMLPYEQKKILSDTITIN